MGGVIATIDNASAHTLFPRMELIVVEGDERPNGPRRRGCVGGRLYRNSQLGHLRGSWQAIINVRFAHSDIGSQNRRTEVASTGD